MTAAPGRGRGAAARGRAREARERLPARPGEAPFLGVGIGLRPPHYRALRDRAAAGDLEVDWLEAVSENYMVPGGRPLRVLAELRRARPLVLHGVSMNLGSTDPLDEGYLAELAELAARFEPAWLSDHLCWTGVGGRNLHDLLPLPYTEEAIAHVASRIARVQDRLGRRIAVENVSSYVGFADSAVPEWEFLSAVAERADCGILLDVNNVYVSACNHGFDPERYLRAIDPSRVFQIHLAGHTTSGPLRIDTHDRPVCDEVWALYEGVVRRMGPVSTLIEWDGDLPPLERLCEEAARARAALARAAPRDEEDDEHAGRYPAASLASAHRP